jgi:peptidyl-dipeptidase Dcp
MGRDAAELFAEAFTIALAEERAEIEAIASSSEPPTFANSVKGFDQSGRMRMRVSRLFAVATENITNPHYQALEREWEPKLTAASDANFMNSKLFSRIAAVHSSAARREPAGGGEAADRAHVRPVRPARCAARRRGEKAAVDD